MKLRLLILMLLFAFTGQGQTTVPLAKGSPNAVVRVYSDFQVDSIIHALSLKNFNGDAYMITTDTNGKFMLRPVPVGSGSGDQLYGDTLTYDATRHWVDSLFGTSVAFDTTFIYAALALKLNISDTTNKWLPWNLTYDPSSTNEIQVLSINNDTIFLTNGGFVVLPAGQLLNAGYAISGIGGGVINVDTNVLDPKYLEFVYIDADTLWVDGEFYPIPCVCSLGGSGTVTSVELILPSSIFNISGVNPITSAGAWTVTFDNQNANTVFAGPTTGSATTPAFRSLVSDDIPSLPISKTTGLQTALDSKLNIADSNTCPGYVSFCYAEDNYQTVGNYLINSISTAKLWGRTTAGTGVIEEIGVSNNMILSGQVLDVRNGVADGSTKGVLALDASDFNTASGVGSIDWTNTQAASGSQPGKLTAVDWTTFNSKQAPISGISGVSDGDLFYWNGGTLARLGIGSTNDVLKTNGSGFPEWGAPGSGTGTDDWPNFTNVPQNIQDLEAIVFSANDYIQYVGGVLTNRTPAQVKTSLNIVFSDIGSPPTTLSGYGITDGQPLDADLTAIAGLSPTNDDIIQRKAGAWTNRSMSQLKTDLNITWSDIGSKPTTISGFGITDGVTLTGTETLGNKTLTTPTIGSFVNATHNHTNSTGGGQLTDAALSSAVGVAKGGTGLTSTTAYGVLLGGTTSTGAFQNAGTGTAGQILTSAGSGSVPVWANKEPTINAQTGTTYTLQASDNNNVVTISNSSPITVTIPSGLVAGFNCLVVQIGTGQITFSASGTTVNNRQSFTKSKGQYAPVTIFSYATNVFLTAGDME